MRLAPRRSLVALPAAAFVLIAVPAGAGAAIPGADLQPIKGVAYQPAPSNYPGPDAYYDTDFFNADFAQLWSADGGGRGDLREMAQGLGANLIRLYNWNPARNHLSFLNDAHRLGLRVAVPISNYFVKDDPQAAQHIRDIVRQVYVDERGNPSTTPHPAVAMWTVGNEMDLEGNNQDPAVRRANLAKVAAATASLVAAEKVVNASKLLTVSSPVSFAAFAGKPPAIDATQMAMDQMTANPALGGAFVKSRFVAAVNTFNPGAYLRQWIGTFAATIPETAVWFSELGINTSASCNGFPPPCTPSDQQQGAYIAAQWREAPPGTGAVYLGGAAFEFQDEPWKGGTEATFGLSRFSGPSRTVGSYRVDTLVHKPAWDAFRDPVNGVRLLTADKARVAGLSIDDNDVAALDEATGKVERRFDADRAGLPASAKVDTVTVNPKDGGLVMTFAGQPRLPGVGRVGRSDVVEHRAGDFHLLLRGASAGLGGGGPQIDAAAMTKAGHLVVSTDRAGRVAGVRARPQDLVDVIGRKRYLRGAAAGLTTRSENVDGAWIDPRTGEVHLSTTGRFRADDVRGGDADVLIYDPSSDAARLGWRAAAAGAAGRDVEGVAIER